MKSNAIKTFIDNYIDFGINDIDENNPDIPLDFNIDGYIADKF